MNNKFIKSIISLILIFVLTLSCNVTIYAVEENTAITTVINEGIMTGTDNGFEPNKTLTRAEAVTIIVRMYGVDSNTISSYANQSVFNDVTSSHWAAGYINYGCDKKIVNGMGNGIFGADQSVTIAEFLTMIVRYLGYGSTVESEGTWPTNYVLFGIENGLFDDIDSLYNTLSLRKHAAILIANALQMKGTNVKPIVKENDISMTCLDGSTQELNTTRRYVFKSTNPSVNLTKYTVTATSYDLNITNTTNYPCNSNEVDFNFEATISGSYQFKITVFDEQGHSKTMTDDFKISGNSYYQYPQNQISYTPSYSGNTNVNTNTNTNTSSGKREVVSYVKNLTDKTTLLNRNEMSKHGITYGVVKANINTIEGTVDATYIVQVPFSQRVAKGGILTVNVFDAQGKKIGTRQFQAAISLSPLVVSGYGNPASYEIVATLLK